MVNSNKLEIDADLAANTEHYGHNSYTAHMTITNSPSAILDLPIQPGAFLFPFERVDSTGPSTFGESSLCKVGSVSSGSGVALRQNTSGGNSL